MTSYALVGDSQAAGLIGPGGLASKLPIPFADPRVGWTTGRIAGDPFSAALGSSADVILLVTGGNDDPLNVAALLEMVRRAREARKQLVIVGPVFALTDDAARHDRARAALELTARAAHVRWIDAYPLTRDLATPANVHLRPAGYQAYATRLASSLRGSSGVAGVAILGALAFGLAYLATGSARRAAVAAILPP